MVNTELLKLESFVDDMRVIIMHFSAFRKELAKMRDYFVFVNLYCFKKKVNLIWLYKAIFLYDSIVSIWRFKQVWC
jgi:hypothetical protein